MGDLAGMTYFTPDEEILDSGLLTRNYIYSKIVISLGSRAAEIIVFGYEEVSQGSQKDLDNVYFSNLKYQNYVRVRSFLTTFSKTT